MGILTLPIRQWTVNGVLGLLACALVWQTSRAPENYWQNEGKALAPVVEAVKKFTPNDAVLVTPIEGELLRVQSERALVASHHFPFLDQHFLTWYERAQAVWGHESLERSVAKKAYLALSDEQLHFLHQHYGATHALLYKETPSASAVLYEDDHYKLVEIP